MQSDPTRCTDCGGEMEIGFIPDDTYRSILPEKWAKGPPRPHWLAGVKVKMDDCRLVETYRCKSCGVLKSYAR